MALEEPLRARSPWAWCASGAIPRRDPVAVSDLLGLGLALWLPASLRLGELYVAPSRGALAHPLRRPL